MTAPQTRPAGTTLLAVVGVTAAVADGILAALGATAWRSYRDGALTADQAGPFMVIGASAAADAVLALLAIIAMLRAGRGRPLAQATLMATWLRLGAVFTALVVVALTVGVSAAGVFGMAVAVGDAFAGFVITGVAARRTRDASTERRHG